MRVFVGHDLGTSGVKTALVDAGGKLLASASASYSLERPRAGWAEQAPAAWWQAVVETTREVVRQSGVAPGDVVAVSHAGQMLSLVALAADGTPTRPAVSWLDGRAEAQARQLIRRFGGERILAALAGGSPTGKDILPKVAWIRDEEPDVFRRTAAFTDATGYLVARATGKLVIDDTAAGCTGLLSLESRTFSKLLGKLASFPMEKLPRLHRCIDVIGPLTAQAAAELGLTTATQVVMGMADIPAAAVGSGQVRPGAAHVYLGTSSWIGVSLATPKQAPKAGIASVPSADPRGFLLIGESETAGACREHTKHRLGVDDAEFEALASAAAPGSEGLLYLPWLYGERSPVPDSSLRGGYVGLSLDHDRAHLARAVYEGTALNLRWTLEACEGLGERCPTLRAIGGGTRSDTWLECIADITGRPVERVENARVAGAIGAALLAAVGVGDLGSVADIANRVRVDRTFRPRAEHRARYDRAFEAMKVLQPAVARASRLLAPKP